MKYYFTKMHGCGNDYVYFDCFNQEIINPSELSIKVSDRHFGIGSDGIILIAPSNIADAQMIMYNADGSLGNMCGNGIRCVGKYVVDNNLVDVKDEIKIETKSGIKTLSFVKENDLVTSLTVNMGCPSTNKDLIPVIFDKDVINEEIVVDNNIYRMTCVSMGNPHAVIFTSDIDAINLESIGPSFENHEMFPERVNTEFVEIIDNKNLKMRVWERGSGETLACGTGACAVVVASILNGICSINEEITVKLRGGNLVIKYDGTSVFMSGPATKVFDGTIEI